MTIRKAWWITLSKEQINAMIENWKGGGMRLFWEDILLTLENSGQKKPPTAPESREASVGELQTERRLK